MENTRCTRLRNVTIELKDISDGNAVACAIGTYVNSYEAPRECFYEHMLNKDTKVQHNFTMLCLEWFRKLAETSDYDDRNAASHKYAMRMPDAVRFDPLTKRQLSSFGVKRAFEFNFDDDAQAADLLERYLRRSDSNYEFICSMLRIHKTCQQLFSRMCCEWFKRVAQLPSTRKSYVVLARKAVGHYTDFPMI